MRVQAPPRANLYQSLQGLQLSFDKVLETQALARGLFQAYHRALAVADAAIIPAEVELGEILTKMLFADMVEAANDAALQKRKAAFNGIRVSGEPVLFDRVLLRRVIDRVMLMRWADF